MTNKIAMTLDIFISKSMLLIHMNLILYSLFIILKIQKDPIVGYNELVEKDSKENTIIYQSFF